MVLARRQQKSRRLDLAQVDRHPAEGDAARPRQQVLLVHLAQVEAVHRRRHARRIGVPIQQVKREGLLAEQIIVHDERPNQIVGAQHVEGRVHVARFEIALFLHALLERVQLFFIDKDAELAGFGEIDHRDEIGRALDAAVALGRHVGKGRSEQRAAEAIADDIGLALAGRLLDRVERGQWPLAHVILEAFLGEPLVRVDPGNHENRVALLDRPADERVPRPQIEDIELVDPGRDDQQRPPLHGLGGWRILQQLDQIILVDDLAGGRGDILADLECRHVGHRDREPALAALEIVEQVL